MLHAKEVYQEFIQYVQRMAHTDETWRLWVQFVFVDAMAHVALFFAIRSGDWHLRMWRMKNMAPLFTAFDHTTYQKLISNHIHDLLNLPPKIILMFEQGAFVVNINGRPWHSGGIDEAHEMMINKQCKMAITKPSPDYINRIAKYVTYRTKVLERVKQQLFPFSKQKPEELQSIFSTKEFDKKSEKNLNAQLEAIKNINSFEVNNSYRGLVNPFTNKCNVHR